MLFSPNQSIVRKIHFHDKAVSVSETVFFPDKAVSVSETVILRTYMNNEIDWMMKQKKLHPDVR